MTGRFPAGPSGRPLQWLCILAGLCDLVTGLLLVTAPAKTLELMGVPPAGEPIWIRYIGIFVGAIGAAYLHPWWGSRPSVGGLRAMVEITALCRFAVAAFVAGAVLRGELAGGWWTVAVTDAAVASAQLVFLRLFSSPVFSSPGDAPEGASP